MRFDRWKICWCVISVVLSFVFGCGGGAKPETPAAPAELPQGPEGLGPTIGMLTEVFTSDSLPVRGFSLVGGLNGTGSAECPESVRAYLEKYVLRHFAGKKVSINELISSPDTAVVIVDGIVPPAAAKGQRFDVRVAALPGTQTTSLEGGWLYGTDLCEARQLGISIRSLASAEGPVYTDSVAGSADVKSGLVLGGGSVLDDYKINLVLRRPDYRIAGQIRNRINERFGYGTATALAPGSIELQVPSKYAAEKSRFIRLVGATYLAETPELVEKRISSHIRKLVSESNKSADEMVLEAIGNVALPKLVAALNSSDAEVRFRAASCMSYLGDHRGREMLRGIATDLKSAYRIAAIGAIVNSSPKGDALPLLRVLLRDDDFSVRLAAYEDLIQLNDSAVSRELIGDSFYLDQVSLSGEPAIFVSRREQARVALFASPIYCRSDFFVETPDGSVTINAMPGEQTATIIRRHPSRPDIIISLKSSLDLADIIRTLCSEPVRREASVSGPGLGISYSTLSEILKQMADSGAVSAGFHLGPVPSALLRGEPRNPPNIKK